MKEASSEMAVLLSCLKVIEMRLYMAEPKTIYCPRCGRKACVWDGKSTIHPMAKCKKCNKLVVYRIDTGETELKPVPERDTGSGMRFY